MSVLKPRNRVVYFRISQEEYERYTRLCESHGARSLSDLARAAVERLLQHEKEPGSADGPGGVQDRFHSIEQKLDSVTAVLKDLKSALDRAGEPQ